MHYQALEPLQKAVAKALKTRQEALAARASAETSLPPISAATMPDVTASVFSVDSKATEPAQRAPIKRTKNLDQEIESEPNADEPYPPGLKTPIPARSKTAPPAADHDAECKTDQADKETTEAIRAQTAVVNPRNAANAFQALLQAQGIKEPQDQASTSEQPLRPESTNSNRGRG